MTTTELASKIVDLFWDNVHVLDDSGLHFGGDIDDKVAALLDEMQSAVKPLVIERTLTGETVNGHPVLGWMTEVDIPGVGPTRHTDYHWSTPGAGAEVIRLIDAQCLTSLPT